MATSEEKLQKMKQHSCEQPCLCFNLRRAYRVVSGFYDEIFRPLGLRTGQLAVIDVVAKEGPLTICQLAQATTTDRTTLTRNLKPLERGGYIKVISGSADRREKEVVITQKGKAVLEQAYPMWVNVQSRIKDKLGRGRAEKLIHELGCIVQHVDQL